jgi:trimeric autotransporter adhesin
VAGKSVHRSAQDIQGEFMRTRTLTRCLAAATAVTLVGIAGAAVAEPTGANPGESPLSASPAPMWQADGVVWAMAYTEGIVFSGGSFTSVRPPGAAAGQQQTAQARLAAFTSTTGSLLTGWRPTVNGTVTALEISPDGNRLYVGGDFTQVNGQTRNRIAAFDITNPASPVLLGTGAFNGRTNAKVNDILATSTTVYATGAFTTANNTPRTRVAAFTADGGTLTDFDVSLTGAPADVPAPFGTSLSISDSTLFIGGQFWNVDGNLSRGLAAVDATTGDVVPFRVPVLADNGGWITDTLVYDGKLFLVGRVPPNRSGNRLEGIAALDAGTGQFVWGDNGHRCLGDGFGLIALDGIVWMATHAHDCGQIGAFPESDPRFSWHAAIVGQDADTGEQVGFYPQVSGRPSVQGSLNNSRAMATDGSQMFVGGGFLNVLGYGAQQNLIRFVPKGVNVSTAPGRPARPTVTTAGGDATVTWTGVFDRDDRDLTYSVLRGGGNTPITTLAADSPWWNEPTLGYTDTAVNPGQTVSYRIRVTDGMSAPVTSTASANVTVVN